LRAGGQLNTFTVFTDFKQEDVYCCVSNFNRKCFVLRES